MIFCFNSALKHKAAIDYINCEAEREKLSL